MNFINGSPPNAIFAMFAGFVLFLCLLLQILKQSGSKKRRLPPQPSGAWPVLGHLPLLGGKQPSHVTLGDMADKFGPVFTIKIGVHRTLIVSSWEVVKECFTTNDKAFAHRPHFLAAEVMGYNNAMIIFSPYGPYWRQLRKIATLQLLSSHRLEMMKNVRESEVKAAIKGLYQLWDKNKNDSGNAVVKILKELFADITLNVIFRVIFGKRYGNYVKERGGDRWQEVVIKFVEVFVKPTVSDVLPFMRWVDLGGHEKAMKKAAREVDNIIQGWLDERKRKRRLGQVQEDKDFMDVMISATCMALILAGSDTTRVTLAWSLILLLNNPDVLRTAQRELDTNIGRDRFVLSSDTNNLVYLQAILKETLRLLPPASLSVPHESMEDCTVGGYHIPKGTRLLVNLWKMHRDPRVWSDPGKFRSERFLTTHKDFDVKGHNFEILPFGTGRRKCPGASFALQVMQLTLASLLQAFDISTLPDKPVDLDERLRITDPEATKVEVIISPRLAACLYE